MRARPRPRTRPKPKINSYTTNKSTARKRSVKNRQFDHFGGSKFELAVDSMYTKNQNHSPIKAKSLFSVRKSSTRTGENVIEQGFYEEETFIFKIFTWTMIVVGIIMLIIELFIIGRMLLRIIHKLQSYFISIDK